VTITVPTPADVHAHIPVALSVLAELAEASDARTGLVQLPVNSAKIGDTYGYIPEGGGKAKRGTIVSIEYAGRRNHSQLIFGVEGILTKANGTGKVHHIRHERVGTFLGAYNITDENNPGDVEG
jgi:hypothetical protein